MFLLRHWKRTGDAKALEMVEKTLQEIRRGGVYDQVGLGVHRYSTDREWLVPHFEKMLYDQALLTLANLEAYQATGKERYANDARDILSYVLRDMSSPEGGFYSAEDADSEGEEGKFYVWTIEEVKAVLGEEDGARYASTYQFTEEGNFVDEASRERNGSNIPHLAADLAEADRADFEAMRLKLYAAREKRIHPQKDDKILTDWNGLMIAALARGAQVLGDEEYAKASRKAADFVLTRLRDGDGRLLKRVRQGKAGLPGHLEDYAFMVWGLLDLYEATFDLDYLEHAVALNETMLTHFWDADAGGLFLTADDGEQLLVRAKEIYDGAIPSGNSVAVKNLGRLARMTGNTEYEERAEQIVKAFSGQVKRAPYGYNQLLCGVDFALGPTFEIVIAGTAPSPEANPMITALREQFVPGSVVLYRPEGDGAKRLAAVADFTGAMSVRDGAPTAYVCQNFACNQPTTEVDKMLTYLGVRPAEAPAEADDK
jgi:uncharacterized protein YyaL (SSP411 family)